MTQDELKEKMHYDPETGVFTRINHYYKGSTGTKTHRGYIDITIQYKKWAAHRLAWLYVYGYLPEHQVDHINGIRDDNRICNLREAKAIDNLRNSGIRSDNTSRIKGVSWSKDSKKWKATASLNSKSIHLGFFTDKMLAAEAYQEFAKTHHGEFYKNISQQ